ncbi:MAG: SDR family oxidoreductase [Chitinophagaceae bacterium]|nr:SDR family oxidoreductase [Chitinophagaceae bacterium]
MNAIITGATKGIGNAIAEKLLKENYNIIICSRNEVELKNIILEWQKKFPTRKILGFKTDMSLKNEVDNFAKNCLENFEKIDVLINNAGYFIPGNIRDEADGTLEKMLNTNLFSAYHLTRKILPNMIKNNVGHIFNISSVAGIKAYPMGGSYSISKFALEGFSKNLREELKTKNIKVTSIISGATYTNSWSESGIEPSRIMQASDVADALFSAIRLSKNAVIEELILRPQLGDL